MTTLEFLNKLSTIYKAIPEQFSNEKIIFHKLCVQYQEYITKKATTKFVTQKDITAELEKMCKDKEVEQESCKNVINTMITLSLPIFEKDNTKQYAICENPAELWQYYKDTHNKVQALLKKMKAMQNISSFVNGKIEITQIKEVNLDDE